MYLKNFCLLVILILAISLTQISFGQIQNSSSEIQFKSPQISSIERIGYVNTNLSTGQISPSVDICTFSIDGVELPVKLKYSNTGLRVGENASWVGLGWNLFVGGYISQNVKGIPDEGPVGMLYPTVRNDLARFLNNQMSTFERDTYLYNVMNDLEDSEIDIFTFNILGKSGSFYFDENGSIIQFERNDLKINFDLSNNQIISFTILDDDGVSYFFSSKELSSFMSIDPATNNSMIINGNSWYLTSITTPLNDVITFSYEEDPMLMETRTTKSLSFGATAGMSGCTVDYSLANIQVNQFFPLSAQKRIKQISSPKIGTITFNTSPIREDLKDINNQKTKALTEILVKDNQDRLVKKVEFSYGHFLNDQLLEKNRLKLKSVTICGTDCNSPLAYNFTYYNEENPFPPLQYLSKDFDHWGYFNGAGNSIEIPTFNSANIAGFGNVYNGANKNANSQFSKYGMLKTIRYPQGGQSEFDYEANVVNISAYSPLPIFIQTNSPSSYEVGGNRVKIITYRDNVSSVEQKQIFEYSNETTLKYIPNYLAIKEYINEINNVSPSAYVSCGNTFFISERPMNSMPGYHIEYSWVIEKSDISGSNGYTKYIYSKSDDIGSQSQPFPTVVNTNWRSGQILFQESYRNEGGGNFVMDQQFGSLYSSSYHQPMVLGLTSAKIERKITGTMIFNPLAVSYYESSIYTYFTEQIKLDAISKSVYSNGIPLTETTNLYYESLKHFKQTRKKKTLSNGDIIETRLQYVRDFDDNANINISELKQKNLNLLVRQDQFNGSNLIESSVIDYNNVGQPKSKFKARIDMPLSGTTSSTSSYFRNGATYRNEENIYYDQSNSIKTISRLNHNVNYLWNYSNYYPVAEIIGLPNSGIFAYSSFEGDSKGHWLYTGIPVVDATAPTGKMIYILNGSNDITNSELNPATVYILSYWRPVSTGPLYIDGSIPGSLVYGRIVDGWQLFECKITGKSNLDIAGEGKIDELRLYPQTCKIITYTYNLLEGITSKCDANSRIIYYEYDNMGRLKLIRDQDKNILKVYDYKYQQTP